MPLTLFNSWLFPTAQDEELVPYELERRERMANNQERLEQLDKVKLGKVVHIPAHAFPREEAPTEGYWVGKTVKTALGGAGDIGIQIEGEDVFTRPRSEVAHWLMAEPEAPK